MHNIIAISGSLRTNSSNSKIIQTIAGLSTEVDFIISNIIGDLPHFNPDNDKNKTPEIVKTWREQIKKADGVIICTPEYAFGVPGVLKNALDWLVSSGEFVYTHHCNKRIAYGNRRKYSACFSFTYLKYDDCKNCGGR